jgi:hydrogenase expression/formation protein HypC
MCIGIPKKVVSCEGFEGEFAWVERADGSQRERVNMMLVGPQELGSWVLTSLGMARETLTEDEAETIDDALAALEESLAGTYDASQHFADLKKH